MQTAFSVISSAQKEVFSCLAGAWESEKAAAKKDLKNLAVKMTCSEGVQLGKAGEIADETKIFVLFHPL